MKNYRYVLGAVIAALTIISCQKVNNIDEPEVISEGQPFELFASVSETKTSIGENFAVSWNNNDQINVFHAESSSTNYISDGAFSIDDAENGHFVGTVSGIDAEKSYDWYAFYPYDSHIVTPASTSTGYATVGGKGQTQEGNDSYAHIAGSNMPLYGKLTGVNGDATPEIAMKQICSVIEVKVKNTTADPLTVSSVSFTGTEDIVGTYYINFVGESPVLTASGDSYVSKTVSLAVNNGDEIATNGEACFYIAIKPFTAAAGEQLKIAVNGYEKTIDLTKATSFASGKIKKINFTYDFEAGETQYYERVNSAIADWSGEYLLVAPDAGKALSEFSTTSTVYGIGAGVNIDSDKIESTLTTNAYKLTIASASEGSSYVIKRGEEYLTWKSGNSLETASSESDNSRWTISCNDGNVLIKNVADDTREIWWNNGSPRFACYTGKTAGDSYYATALFKLGGGGTPVPPATKYSITVPDNLTGGTVNSDKAEAEAGETVIITAVPDNGYVLESLTANVANEDLSGNKLTFTMPEAAVTISASFIEDNSKSATFSVTSTSAGTLSGDCTGMTATYSSTYSSKCQLTKGNSMTLTISGLSGKTIKGLSLSMRSNSSAGAGYLSVSAGTTQIGSIGTSSSGVDFNKGSWYGAWSTSYVDVTPSITEHLFADENLVITIGATVNSLYCQSFTIKYTESGESGDDATLSSIAIKTVPTKVTYTAGEYFDPTGLVITKTMSDETTEDVAYADYASDFSFNPSLTTALDASNTEVTITYGGKSVDQAITVEEQSTDDEGKYVKVTSTADLADGKYLIVYETGSVALNGMLTADAANNTVVVTISNGEIASTSGIDAAAVTFNAADGSFLGGGGKYIGHTGSSNTLNYSDSALSNVVSFDSGNAVITAGDYVMRFNASSGQERFRYYKSGQQAIQLYKYVTGN